MEIIMLFYTTPILQCYFLYSEESQKASILLEEQNTSVLLAFIIIVGDFVLGNILRSNLLLNCEKSIMD